MNTFRTFSRCAAIGVVLSGCAASQETINEFGSQSRQTEYGARTAMLAKDHGTAHQMYQQASLQFDVTDETYVDGYFYLDKARMEGNRAVMALLDGDEEGARKHFSVSNDLFDSGVSQHKAVLQEREDIKQGVAAVAAIGLTVALGVMGARAQSGANYQQAYQIQQSTQDAMQLTAQTFAQVSQHLAEIHEIEIADDAQDIDYDVWRSAMISDHPISQSIVRVRTSGGNCTGFFIQPRIVATAAHCFDRYESVSVFKLDPRSREDFLQGGAGSQLTTVATYQPDSYDDAITCHPDDVALIVVAEASDHWLELDLNRVKNNSEGMVIGYSGDLDKGYFQRVDYGCKFNRGSQNRVGADCAIYKGNSGGPFFSVNHRRQSSPFRVVGITSCGKIASMGTRTPQGANKAAGIMRLRSIYRRAVSEHLGAGDETLFN